MTIIRIAAIAVLVLAAASVVPAQTTADLAAAAPKTALAILPQEKPWAGASLPDVQPVVVTRKNPVYPEAALKDTLEATVFLSVVIDSTGAVGAISVVKTTNALFDQASIDAMKGWVFKPALRDGKPVPTTVVVPFRYKLDGHSGRTK